MWELSFKSPGGVRLCLGVIRPDSLLQRVVIERNVQHQQRGDSADSVLCVDQDRPDLPATLAGCVEQAAATLDEPFEGLLNAALHSRIDRSDPNLVVHYQSPMWRSSSPPSPRSSAT